MSHAPPQRHDLRGKSNLNLLEPVRVGISTRC